MMKSTLLVASLVLAVGVAAPMGCESSNKSASASAPAKKGGKTLYQRLGGEAAIKAVVNDFVNNSAGDPAVNFTRKGEGMKEWNATPEAVERLKMLLVEQIGEAAGGPQKYTGRDMKTVHKGMNITNDQFNAMATQLTLSLKRFGVADADAAELIAVVAGMRGDIVGQ
ncbi:MAG: group I truncated hemoglobin [Phycisphaerales bacterium]